MSARHESGERAQLEQCIVASVRPHVGSRLESVVYRCIRQEAGSADVIRPDFYLGGEVLLRFDDGDLYVSWDENAGWRSHFSIGARSSSLFVADANLEPFDAAASPHWSSHVGQFLREARVIGDEYDAPCAIEFEFPGGTVGVACSRRTEIGDGDDVFVFSGNAPTGLPILWSSSPA